MSKKLNEIEMKEIAKTSEQRQTLETYDGSIKCGVAWIRKSKNGDYYLSGNFGNNCNVMIFPVKEKLYENQKDYNVSISGVKRESSLFKVGGLNRFKDENTIWFGGYIFNIEFFARKNPYQEENQPDYILYFGKEVLDFRPNKISDEEFANSFK